MRQTLLILFICASHSKLLLVRRKWKGPPRLLIGNGEDWVGLLQLRPQWKPKRSLEFGEDVASLKHSSKPSTSKYGVRGMKRLSQKNMGAKKADKVM